MKGLLLVLLAVAVGDKRYDPEVYVNAAPYGSTKNRGVCYAYTGFWVVDEVGTEDGKTYAASEVHSENLIHAIFSTFDIDWEAYWDQERDMPQAMRECAEYDNNLSWLKVCVDFRKRPDLLPLVCQ